MRTPTWAPHRDHPQGTPYRDPLKRNVYGGHPTWVPHRRHTQGTSTENFNIGTPNGDTQQETTNRGVQKATLN